MIRRTPRFGVLTKGCAGRQRWEAWVKRAEALGYDMVLLPDHVDPQLALGPAVVSGAGATTTVRFGSYVTNLDMVLPELLAQEAVSIALLTEGRFELGVGAGWKTSDYEQTGTVMSAGPQRFERFRQRLARLTDAVDVQADSLGGPDHANRRSWMPLMVGAGGPCMLDLAGEQAEIVGLNRRAAVAASRARSAKDIAWTTVAEKARRARAAADRAGRDVELSILLTRVVIGDGVGSARRVPATAAGTDEMAPSPELLLSDGVEEAIAHVSRLVLELDITYIAVPDTAMDPFAAVLDEVRSRFAAR